jgi:hypothetical protein
MNPTSLTALAWWKRMIGARISQLTGFLDVGHITANLYRQEQTLGVRFYNGLQYNLTFHARVLSPYYTPGRCFAKRARTIGTLRREVESSGLGQIVALALLEHWNDLLDYVFKIGFLH